MSETNQDRVAQLEAENVELRRQLDDQVEARRAEARYRAIAPE